MSSPTIAHALEEFMTFGEILDDAYWEASSIAHKDQLYDIISIFTHEVAELNKLSIQDHHYPYEIITEGMGRVLPKLDKLIDQRENIVQRTATLIDLKEVTSNIMDILEQQQDCKSDFK